MSVIIFASNLLSRLIRLWPSKSFRLGLPKLQVLFIDSRGLLVDRLGFLGTVEKDLETDLFFEVKKLPGRCLYTLIGKA